MGLSFMHLLVILVVVLIVFGAGRLPSVMGDLGKGIRNFKAGLNGDPMEGGGKDADKKFLESPDDKDKQDGPKA